jgi:D-alanyl-D-alanine carboxypeptidase
MLRLIAFGLALAVAFGAHADEIDDYVLAQMSQQNIPGLSIAVLKTGKPVKVKGYGLANLELDTAAKPETVYKIGSLSKQFIAAGIVLLNKDGKIGLDDSITQYLQDAPESWRPITVRHALTHTSGLIREAPGFAALKVQSDARADRFGYRELLYSRPVARAAALSPGP